MSALASHIQRQIERYADGALNRTEADEIEALLQTHDGARAHLRSIEQVRLMPQLATEAHSASIDFDALEDSIMRAVQTGAQTHSSDYGALVSQWVDNELRDPDDHQKVFSYLAENQAGRVAVEGIREVGHATRAYVRAMEAQVDFDALEAKCLALFEGNQDFEGEESNVTPLRPWYARYKAPLAAVAGIAAATAILLPLSFGALDGGGQNQFTSIDEMNVDAGYSGTITHGTRKSAPVVWFSDDEESTSKEPINPLHDEDTDESPDAP